MPNGGMLPSCFSCKWAEKSTDFGESLRHCYCTRHAMHILGSHLTFCTDLSTYNDTTELGSFIHEEAITGHDVYIWIETDPMTVGPLHAYRLLAPIATYANWNEEQIRAARRAKQQEE